MKLLRYLLPVAAILLAAPAYAHFLWINVVRDTSGQATAQLCFGEEGAPGEAHLVDRLAKVKLLSTKAGEKPTELKTEKQLTGETGFFGSKLASDDVALTSSQEYGLIERGGAAYLLHYYAKNLNATKPESLKTLARAENLRLDVVPSINKDEVELVVLFDGKPAPAGSQVLVEVPDVGRDEYATDADGKVKFKVQGGGNYEIRARVKEEKPGERDGKKYAHEMHYSTLVMTMPTAAK